MLVSVVALSRPDDGHPEEKTDEPKGPPAPRRLFRWGMEPARRRESIVGFEAALEAAMPAPGSIPVTPGGRNGLVEGVGREVCDMNGS